jgi:putative protease
MKRKIELLAPAKDIAIGIAAIRHGADAVYIGASSHGARQSAANSVEEIAQLVQFAHIYRARVYVTVNTLVYDNELSEVETLVWKLYKAGVDALIVQDMALLRMNLPPIELHASTQCDIRTPDKAAFLESVGFSQLVLARELSLTEIKSITDRVSVPVETFVHGALCVSYSGRCNASQYCFGRSANRGNCAQLCRFSYDLADADGKIIKRNKHLLSLHDFNTLSSLEELLDAGVSSLKIEGRLKDISYVKNIVAAYSTKLNDIIAANPDKYQRASFGRSELKFTPNPTKSFNRGFTDYFLHNRRPSNLASWDTPKTLGEPLDDVSQLNNGDGVAFFDSESNYVGVRVNSISKGNINTYGSLRIPKHVQLFRTFDRCFEDEVQKSNPERKLWVDISLTENSIIAEDERGVRVAIAMDATPLEGAKNEDKIRSIFAKLGNTPFELRNFTDSFPEDRYLAPSLLTALRRKLIATLESAAIASYQYTYRRKEDASATFPYNTLIYSDNVANRLAKEFYLSHGVEVMDRALEVSGEKHKGMVIMTCRHCILREIGACLKKKSPKYKQPLTLSSGQYKFELRFNCKDCEMQVCS